MDSAQSLGAALGVVLGIMTVAVVTLLAGIYYKLSTIHTELKKANERA